MFVLFTPYSFIFFSLYSLLLLSLFTISNFFYFWMVMELMMLLFMGLSYTLFVCSYSQLMNYFLIQAISSFSILLSYIYLSPSALTISFLMKLSMFPFYSWYINVAYRFPNLILWLSGTLHKLPILLLLTNFNLILNYPLLWLSMIFTTLLSGVIMLMVVDFRMILVLSSIGNNSWLLLSQMAGMLLFLSFFLIYAVSLYCVLHHFKGLSKYTYHLSPSATPYSLSLWVLTLSGMPPLPLFYLKISVLMSLFLSDSFNFLAFMFLIVNSFMLMAYLQSLMKYFIYQLSSLSHYLIKF